MILLSLTLRYNLIHECETPRASHTWLKILSSRTCCVSNIIERVLHFETIHLVGTFSAFSFSLLTLHVLLIIICNMNRTYMTRQIWLDLHDVVAHSFRLRIIVLKFCPSWVTMLNFLPRETSTSVCNFKHEQHRMSRSGNTVESVDWGLLEQIGSYGNFKNTLDIFGDKVRNGEMFVKFCLQTLKSLRYENELANDRGCSYARLQRRNERSYVNALRFVPLGFGI